MKNLIISIFVLSFVLLTSCNVEKISSEAAISLENVTIRSGQSFGFCVGKCYSEMTIKGKNVTLLVKETSTKGNSTIKNEFTYNDVITESQVATINDTFDFSIFNSQPDIVGCPDCADGGAEWLEIDQGKDNIKRITFEYGKEVPGLEKIIGNLRSQRDAMLKKFVK
jgi:hypothetical protein